MMRVTAYQDVNGYNETMIAGEDPEICVRLRLRGWKVIRLHTDMTIHDAAITRFSQWWLRSLRGGHSCAEKAHLHRHTPGRTWRRETRSAWLWGLLLPFAILLLIWPTRGLSLLALVAYLIWILRIALARRRHFSDSWRDAFLYALFCMLGKCPWAIGQLRFWRNHLRGHPSALIEYK